MIGTTGTAIKDGDEIGFWIHEKYEGNGYATESTKAIIDYAFKNKGLNFLESSVHRDNVASRRVHEKLGFVKIDVTERFWPNKNTNVPVVLHRLDKIN